MEDENRKPKALTQNAKSNDKEVVEKRKFETKDLVFTAIIAFLIGAIITAGGFAIEKTVSRGMHPDFRQNSIQRNFEPGEFDNNQSQKNKNGRREQRPNQNGGQNSQTAPNNGDQQPNTQNPQNSQNNRNMPNTPNNQNNT